MSDGTDGDRLEMIRAMTSVEREQAFVARFQNLLKEFNVSYGVRCNFAPIPGTMVNGLTAEVVFAALPYAEEPKKVEGVSLEAAK